MVIEVEEEEEEFLELLSRQRGWGGRKSTFSRASIKPGTNLLVHLDNHK
jgi:hypothetical protein